MSNINQYNLIFIGWNLFQFIYIEELAHYFNGSIFVLEDRENGNVDFFLKKVINKYNIPIKVYKTKDILNLDTYDKVIIAQSKFKNIYKFKRAKVVFLQYGYAKEKYNFGLWRSLASLNLVFGEYAYNKIIKISPSEIVGNPKYIKLYKKNFYKNVLDKYKIDQSKKTILYLPTWGRLSSFNIYLDSIVSLSKDYNVLIKLHHNSDFFENIDITKNSNVLYFGSQTDSIELIALADIVISDYSGAIFDAIYCNKPLILLNIPFYRLLFSKKVSFKSIEILKRKYLGHIINKPEDLYIAINNILSKKHIVNNYEYSNLRKKLFVSSEYTIDKFEYALNNLFNNKYNKNFKQKIYDFIIKRMCFVKYKFIK